ncbi:hypothetical protein [Kordiimonas lipolytica]|nr:hypothetical protein [Kordiimonas lipolytica]
MLAERGIGFAAEFEHLPAVDDEPYCGFLTADKLVRIELYVDSANIVTFFDGKEESICLECYEGHASVAVAEDFKVALASVLKRFEGVRHEDVLEHLDDKGIQSRWAGLFRR